MQFGEVCPEQGEFRGRAPRGSRKAGSKEVPLEPCLKGEATVGRWRGTNVWESPGRGNWV